MEIFDYFKLNSNISVHSDGIYYQRKQMDNLKKNIFHTNSSTK